MLLGVFNLHHLLWGGAGVEAEDAEKPTILTEEASIPKASFTPWHYYMAKT